MASYPKISEAEWQVMKALWDAHPLTANTIVERLSLYADWKPKTIKTLISRLVGKGAVGFTKQGREYAYHPLVRKEEILREESRHFLKRFFNGAFKPMLASLVEDQDLTDEEIEELKRVLDRAGNDPGRKKRPDQSGSDKRE